MNLYIQIINDSVKNHPALEENLIQAFGEIPTNWEQFIRVDCPLLGLYQVLESDNPVYTKVDGVWTDVWTVREMTAEEKNAKQQAVITAFNAREQSSNWSAWTLDEITCTMQPPIPRPDPDQVKLDAKVFTFWCGANENWRDTPARPDGNYKFDFLAWQWVEI